MQKTIFVYDSNMIGYEYHWFLVLTKNNWEVLLQVKLNEVNVRRTYKSKISPKRLSPILNIATLTKDTGQND